MNLALAIEAQKKLQINYVREGLKFRSDFNMEKFQPIVEMLEDGVSFNQICRRMHVSRSTVARIDNWRSHG